MMDPNDYDALLTALVASFTSVNSAVLVPAALLLALLAWALRRDLALLDVLALGPESAVSLGVDYRGAVMRLMVGVALAIAAATAVVGPLSFLGLITANIAREATGTFRHAVLVPASILAGIAVLAAGELAVEQAMNFAVPVSVFVTLLGGSYFLWLILRAKETEQ
jgi:iron complex transport system permease protein